MRNNRPSNIYNCFNDHFIDFECPRPKYAELRLPQYEKTFYLTPTTPKEIGELLANTTSKPAAGIDEIGGQVLKAISSIISEALSMIIY